MSISAAENGARLNLEQAERSLLRNKQISFAMHDYLRIRFGGEHHWTDETMVAHARKVHDECLIARRVAERMTGGSIRLVEPESKDGIVWPLRPASYA